MDNTLIIFASNHGSVEKCARELFRLINGKVDICNLNRREIVPDLTKYDAVIVGGSIHSGKIEAEIAAFCAEHVDELAAKRLGLFINCLYAGEKAQRQLDEAFPEELSRKAVVRDYFGGEMDEFKFTLWEKIVATQMIEEEDLVLALSKDKIRRFAELMSETQARPDKPST